MSAGTPGPLSRTQNSSGRLTGVGDPGVRRRTPGRKAVVSSIVPSIVSGPERLGGVLDEVEEDLDQLVAIAEHRRQRGIVGFGEADVAREARLRDALHVVEHGVDVDALALDRPQVREGLHPVDELHDPVGLLADQPRQRPVLVAHRRLEQLGGAADARQRVLDLVRQHGGQRRN